MRSSWSAFRARTFWRMVTGTAPSRAIGDGPSGTEERVVKKLGQETGEMDRSEEWLLARGRFRLCFGARHF